MTTVSSFIIDSQLGSKTIRFLCTLSSFSITITWPKYTICKTKILKPQLWVRVLPACCPSWFGPVSSQFEPYQLSDHEYGLNLAYEDIMEAEYSRYTDDIFSYATTELELSVCT